MNSALVFTVVIISDLLLLKICRATWMEWSHPIFLIDVFYMLLIIAAYIGLKKYPWSFEGIAWITTALYFLTIGGALGKQIYRNKRSYYIAKNTVYVQISNKAWLFVVSITALGIAGAIYQVLYNGFSLSDFTSLDSLAQMNNAVAVERYSGGGQSNIFTKISTIAAYIPPVCGGLLFPFSNTKFQKGLSLSTMLPILLLLLFTNGKAGFLASLVLWGSSFLTAYFYRYKKAPAINFRKLLFYSLGAVLVLGILLFTMMLRIGKVDIATFEIVTDKFMSYAFGGIQSFDRWLSFGRDNIEYSAGVQTFMGFFQALGIVHRKQGVYTFLPGTSSNVYTLFRGVIEDFGVLGGLVFVAVCGCFAGYCSEGIRCSVSLPVLPVVTTVGICFFFIYGYIISPWIYSSFIVMMVAFAYFLMLCKKRSIRVKLGKIKLLG